MSGFDQNTGNVDFVTIQGAELLVDEVVEYVRKAVVSTMGPNGKVSVISAGTRAKVTKDGVTVARSIKFNDPRKELVNRIVTEASLKTDEECGDGTTTTTLLMAAFFKLYREFDTYQDQALIDRLVKLWITVLQEATIHVDALDERLYHLALTSSNNDAELAKLVVDLYREDTGSFPSIDLIQGVESDDKVHRTDGLAMGAVYSNHQYAPKNMSQGTYEYYVPLVLDLSLRDSDGQQLTSLLKHFAAQYGQGHDGRQVTVILIARAFESTMDNVLLQLNNMVVLEANKTNSKPALQFVACRVNGAGGSIGSYMLQDIAIMLGCPMVNTIEQGETVELPIRTDKLVISSTRSVLTPSEDSRKRIAERVKEVQAVLGNYDGKNRYNTRARFDERRVRQMTGKLVTIWVGGETDSDIIERKDRFEDVIKAVKSALVNGIVPGVGVTLIETAKKLPGVLHAESILPGGLPLPKDWEHILGGVIDIAHIQHDTLMEGLKHLGLKEGQVMNLANGAVGTPSELGIYDTAFASITALKGGAAAAKILANLRSIMISNKLDMRSLDN